MNDHLRNTIHLAADDGPSPRIQGIRIAPGATARYTLAGHIGGAGRSREWPGKGYGIRGPLTDETPLSWDEVKTVLQGVRDAMK